MGVVVVQYYATFLLLLYAKLCQNVITEFELDGINSGSCIIAYQEGYIIDNESEIVQQLCVK